MKTIGWVSRVQLLSIRSLTCIGFDWRGLSGRFWCCLRRFLLKKMRHSRRPALMKEMEKSWLYHLQCNESMTVWICLYFATRARLVDPPSMPAAVTARERAARSRENLIAPVHYSYWREQTYETICKRQARQGGSQIILLVVNVHLSFNLFELLNLRVQLMHVEFFTYRQHYVGSPARWTVHISLKL